MAYGFVFLQERSHFDSLTHPLAKLGEDGQMAKIGQRVIDLTRPEDLDGKQNLTFLSPNSNFISH